MKQIIKGVEYDSEEMRELFLKLPKELQEKEIDTYKKNVEIIKLLENESPKDEKLKEYIAKKKERLEFDRLVYGLTE